MLPNHVYVAMFGPMPELPTGLAMSVLRRAQAFANADISTEILIDTFYPDYDRHTARLTESGRLGDKISIRSMYQDLAAESCYPSDVAYNSPMGEDGWSYVQDENREEAFRGRKNGEYKHFVWMRGEKVHFIDHMQDGRRLRREWHDEAGKVCKIEVMGSENKPEVIRYVNRNGDCYLEELTEPKTGRIRGLVLTAVSGPSLFFADQVDLFAYWMQNFVLSGVEAPTIISEYGIRRRALAKIESENEAKIVFTLHNNHLIAPHTYGSAVRAEMRDFFDHLGDYRDVVVLTDEQRQDIWKQFGYRDSIHVIPHHIPPSNGVGPRSPNKVVVVGRFDQVKGQMAALGAFAEVIKSVPEAKLAFYGRGTDEPKIREEIKRLHLSESAQVVGFTSDSYQVFSEASVSITASVYEGFCLSLGESMAAGCVPVSYQFKYGPLELISHGHNGMIVQPGNIKELADTISFLLKNDEHRSRMSAAAVQAMDTFSEVRLVNQWMAVLEN